jgi:hypothetical protein
MKYFFRTALIITLMFSGTLTLAQSTNTTGGSNSTNLTGGSSVTIDNPLKATSIVLLFQTILDIVLIFAVPIIVFFIIYAGFLYVTARGNAGTIEKAHMALLYALIGGLLILGARVLIEVIQGTVDSIIK